MSRKTKAAQQELFTSRYEEDFLARTLGDFIRKPDVALGELVANAWDAGAAEVRLTIPKEKGGTLTVEDDGSGLTKEQFEQRWMTLGYNRQKNQGGDVEFPPGREGPRQAYGRNGQGRHSLFCFADSYRVTTIRDGGETAFEVKVSKGENPFVSRLVSQTPRSGYGTRLSVVAQRNLPDADRIRAVLGTKFLHDPGFVVSVNGTTLPMADLPGFAGKIALHVTDPATGRDVKLSLSVVEGEAGRMKHQSGVAFWISKRLVGEPGWTVMGEPIVDGRTRPGRRLTFVVESDDLLDEVLPDWTGFRPTSLTDNVKRVVVGEVQKRLVAHYAEHVRETTADVLNSYDTATEPLGRSVRNEIAEVVQGIVRKCPLTTPAVLNAAVEGVIDAKKNASAQRLFQRIGELPADDIDGLHRLLDEWSVRDALTVLDEIGRRIKVVEAIEKLMGDKSVDELQVLHPLITQARWLFGPEFDSPHYSANLGLRNAMTKLFGGALPSNAAFKNSRKRPDLLVREESTLCAVSTEDTNGANIVICRRVLLVELKKGGFRIGREEMAQACGYVEDLLGSGHLPGSPFIHTFVVGYELDPQTTMTRKVGDNPEKGRVDGVTFAQLVATANGRLFRIRDEIEDRCPPASEDLMQQLRRDSQIGLDLPEPES